MDLIPVDIVRSCGHVELLWVQPPTDYIVELAAEEICSRCKMEASGVKHNRVTSSWWITVVGKNLIEVPMSPAQK